MFANFIYPVILYIIRNNTLIFLENTLTEDLFLMI